MKILIVDDSLDNQRLLKSILGAAGHTDLLTADSALDAFKQLGMDNSASFSTDIDLILMDIVMPEIDGIEACRLIKTFEHLRDIPVIMVTAAVQTIDLQMAFAAGAIDYITKPLNKVELLARLSSALRLKREIDDRKARELELLKLTKQLEEANQKLHDLSILDGLTGIANRRRFNEVLGLEWRRAIRDATPLSLILIDFDFFKAYNDTYGHQMGDDCLKRVANSLKGMLKRPTDLIARYGGEEFVVLLPKTDAEGAAALADEMRAGVEALGIAHALSQVTDRVTISLGVATIVPNPDSSYTELVAEADQALYQAKQGGRNRVKSFDVIVEDKPLIKEVRLC